MKLLSKVILEELNPGLAMENQNKKQNKSGFKLKFINNSCYKNRRIQLNNIRRILTKRFQCSNKERKLMMIWMQFKVYLDLTMFNLT